MCVHVEGRVCVCVYCLYQRWIGRPSCAELTLSPKLGGCMERSEGKPNPQSPTAMEDRSVRVCVCLCVYI